jgi:serine/threonine protein kinase
MSRVGERQFGPYRLVRQIAVGGMAEIHLAKTKGIAGFEKYVALKMIHPNFAEDEQFIQMLVDEAKIAVQLNHGNIAQTFDLGRVGDTFYITMEYVDGADLYKILRKGSEIDGFEMPLDICAFVAKEIASALDHAHRKRDHAGKALGIVHRDVSPQNVLISFSGEVKLVDFGIAKATMKARQTAVGVIKGKYYYMSPEQAWGDQIDYRSDIFSAGIVLYEMITGQMLYLEEDLHRLLDMARNANIASPSTLRKGIPPQLERIVMHALAKDRRDRYQSAGDFATDLERFLHAYSPVFTAAKVAAMVKNVVGEPVEIPDNPEVEVRDGPIATHTLSTEDLIMDKEELQDENSVIFRVSDLKPKQPIAAPRQKQPSGGFAAGPRVTRQADMSVLNPPTEKPAPVKPAAKPAAAPAKAMPLPSMPRPQSPSSPPKPRDKNEVTRQVEPMLPSGPTEDSGLLGVLAGPPPAALRKQSAPDHGELDNIGESTMISGGPPSFGGGFLMENASEDGVDATMISAGPPRGDDTDENLAGDTTGEAEGDPDDDTNPGDAPGMDADAADHGDGEDGPTVLRDWRQSAKPKASRNSAPAALAAKIHAPAVSEIRKPRASRKTPAGGVPAQQPNVLQAIVGAKPGEAMPTPRAATKTKPPPGPTPPRSRNDDSGALTLPGDGSVQPVRPGQPRPPTNPPLAQPPPAQPPPPQQPWPAQGAPQQPGYLPPQGSAGWQAPPPYPQQPGYPPPYQGAWPTPTHGGYAQPQVTPGALYPLQPYGAPPPKPMTLTGQLRLFEADEIGAQYKVSGGGGRWFKIVLATIVAVSVAAGVTFFIIKSSGDSAPTVGSVRIESVPAGAEVTFDNTRMAGSTPLTINSVPVGTRHEVKVQLAKHKAYVETVDIPKRGGEVPVKAILEPITGKIRVLTSPDGADIYLDGQPKGRAPRTIEGVDMSSAKVLELRLKDYQPIVVDLSWPANGEINVNAKLTK